RRLRSFPTRRSSDLGQTGQFADVGDMPGPGLSGIHQLVGEAALQLRQTHLQLTVALLLLRRQGNAGQPEIAQGMLDDGLLGYIRSEEHTSELQSREN